MVPETTPAEFGARWSKLATPSLGRLIGRHVDAGDLTGRQAAMVVLEIVLGGERGFHTLAVAEVADFVGVSVETVRAARDRGRALGLVDVEARFYRDGSQRTSKASAGRKVPRPRSGWCPLLTAASLRRAFEAAQAERSASLWRVVRAWITGELEHHHQHYASRGAAHAISRAISAAGILDVEGRKASFFCSGPARVNPAPHCFPKKDVKSLQRVEVLLPDRQPGECSQSPPTGREGRIDPPGGGAHHGEGLSGGPPNAAAAAQQGYPTARLRREAGQGRMRRCASGKSRRCWGSPLGDWEFCTACWRVMSATERWPTYLKWRNDGSQWAEIETRTPPSQLGVWQSEYMGGPRYTDQERESARRGLAMARAALNRGGDAPSWLDFKADAVDVELPGLEAEPEGYDVDL